MKQRPSSAIVHPAVHNLPGWIVSASMPSALGLFWWLVQDLGFGIELGGVADFCWVAAAISLAASLISWNLVFWSRRFPYSMALTIVMAAGFLLVLSHIAGLLGFVPSSLRIVAGHNLAELVVLASAGAIFAGIARFVLPILTNGAIWGLAAATTAACLILLHNAIWRVLLSVGIIPMPLRVGSLIVFGVLTGLLIGARLADFDLIASDASIARRRRFRVLANALPVPVTVSTIEDSSILFANERAARLFDFSEVAEGLSERHFVRPEDHRATFDLINRYGEVEGQEVEMRRSDNTSFWSLLAARRIEFDGRDAIVSSIYDISDRKEAEAALLASEVRYALISRASNDGIWDWDIPSGVVYYSSRWREIVGADPSRPINTLEAWLSRLHPDDSSRVRREIDDHLRGLTPQLDTEYRLQHGNGHYCWMQCRGLALRNKDGEPIRVAGSQSDVTLRKTYEINLLNAAYEDRLTGINNRAFFNHLIDTRQDPASISDTAIALFNVDQFRRVNDVLGNGAGDALLVAIARRLAARVGDQDALCHLGGDEFAVWLQKTPDHEAARGAIDQMFGDLSLPYALGDVELPITISVGLATPTLGDAVSGADLLRNARLALDRAKLNDGGRVELFDDALLQETHLRRRLSKDLTNAERLGQIYFEYQPIVELDSAGGYRISAFESLMRWRHPELGAISPVVFIPIAEETGLIGALGLFAIETAVNVIKDWSARGLLFDKLSICVNLSARQISDRASVARLHALLDRLNVEPGRIKLEITESLLMSDPETMVTTLESLRSRGVPLQLDDFGTGYSSLSYLHRFPLDVLKIDRSFVTRMSSSQEAFRLVRSIIELGHDLGLKVVAEGVEELAEVEQLRDLGCDFGQGYYFARPVGVGVAADFVSRGTL